MRYIPKKTTEPICLSEYKDECRALNVPLPLLYKSFNRTSELSRELQEEQRYVCCYCQRAVTGFRIEHSYPENGLDKARSEALQLDYTNLFAACVDSQKRPKHLQYCDVAKGNTVIPEFIKEKDCQTHFRYLATGEIIPNGQYYTWQEYEDNVNTLPKTEQEAFYTIKALNLNCSTLREGRKMCLDELLDKLSKRTKNEWQKMISHWLASEKLPDYIELRLQYLEAYLSR